MIVQLQYKKKLHNGCSTIGIAAFIKKGEIFWKYYPGQKKKEEPRFVKYYPGQKKRRTKIRGKKTAVPTRGIMLNHARSAQGKSRG